jgi:hypothetical protein
MSAVKINVYIYNAALYFQYLVTDFSVNYLSYNLKFNETRK